MERKIALDERGEMVIGGVTVEVSVSGTVTYEPGEDACGYDHPAYGPEVTGSSVVLTVGSRAYRLDDAGWVAELARGVIDG